MSLGVLVVEGDIKSGALITARQALEQNREVFAVPGSIYSPNSRGTNKLIQDGEAKLTLDVEDILAELNLSMAAQQIEMTELVPADETESDAAALHQRPARPHRRGAPRKRPADRHRHKHARHAGAEGPGEAGRPHELRPDPRGGAGIGDWECRSTNPGSPPSFHEGGHMGRRLPHLRPTTRDVQPET